ncbi:hypothetical protein Tph_c00940 [Thermacetogenium phaeum DSM 12270]|uniref:SPOR domain-containing protein n=1 Tax=Thermacetogenium phaeum (strain ATCC BAA-254 / DSM 26808 / PB) TaxID=1089553 RepID=K4LE51_THEPS|nr:SPOR domain-containing protein [Thermacetogenium phaeum]AFV10342.1 hypothetical protein Tph_c00940 [Thermacetogenium phaeum DSM 12270]MDN5366008.1 hypothetical protein [Thermacetogenium sp.]MDN5375557.1 hypothetical protein [Thermacetogenium sp.]
MPVLQTSGLWRVQVGAFVKKEKAEALAERLRAAGFDAWVVLPTMPQADSNDST